MSNIQFIIYHHSLMGGGWVKIAGKQKKQCV